MQNTQSKHLLLEIWKIFKKIIPAGFHTLPFPLLAEGVGILTISTGQSLVVAIFVCKL